MRIVIILLLLPVLIRCQTATVNRSYRIAKTDTLAGFSIMQGSDNTISFNLANDPGGSPDTLRFAYDNSKINLSIDSLVFTTGNFTVNQDVILSAPTRTDSLGLEYWNINITKNNDYSGVIWVKTFDHVFDTAAIQEDLNPYFHYTDGDTASLNTLRNLLIDTIYSTGQNPTGNPDTIDLNIPLNSDSTVFYPGDLTKIGQFNRYAVVTVNDTASWTNYYWHIMADIPRTNPRSLILMSYGHRGFGIGGEETLTSCYNINGLPDLFKYFNDRGYDLLISHMPISCKNIGDGKVNSGLHNNFQDWESSGFNPLQIYTTGWYKALNYCLSSFTYNSNNIYMTGISGGGWMATIQSAIDKRIKKSFAVAGTYPIYVRELINTGNTNGDYEQGGVSSTRPYDLYRNNISYLDMYLLSAQDGEHYQIINKTDDCCFNGLWWQSYRDELKVKATAIDGFFDVYMYTNPVHTYDLAVFDFIYSKIRYD